MQQRFLKSKIDAYREKYHGSYARTDLFLMSPPGFSLPKDSNKGQLYLYRQHNGALVYYRKGHAVTLNTQPTSIDIPRSKFNQPSGQPVPCKDDAIRRAVLRRTAEKGHTHPNLAIPALKRWTEEEVVTLKTLATQQGRSFAALDAVSVDNSQTMSFTPGEVFQIEKILADEEERLRVADRQSLWTEQSHHDALAYNEKQFQLCSKKMQENIAELGVRTDQPERARTDEEATDRFASSSTSEHEWSAEQPENFETLYKRYQVAFTEFLQLVAKKRKLFAEEPSIEALRQKRVILQAQGRDLKKKERDAIAKFDKSAEGEAEWERCDNAVAACDSELVKFLKEQPASADVEAKKSLLNKTWALLKNVDRLEKEDYAHRLAIQQQVKVRQENKEKRDANHKCREKLATAPPALPDLIPYIDAAEIQPVVDRYGEAQGFTPIYFPDYAHTEPGRFPLYLVDMNQRLGGGAFGSVYAAYGVNENGEVQKDRATVKMVRPAPRRDLLTDVRHELSIMRSKFSPRTDAFLFEDVDGPVGYIISDYGAGKSLSSGKNRSDEMAHASFAEKMAFFVALVQNVDLLHHHTASTGKAIQHADFKGGNILVRHRGTDEAGRHRVDVRIIDYGMAERLEDDDPRARWAHLAIRGTPGYVAPEAVRGEGQGIQGDLILYMLLHMLGANPRALIEQKHEALTVAETNLNLLQERIRLLQEPGKNTTQAVLDDLRTQEETLSRETKAAKEAYYQTPLGNPDSFEGITIPAELEAIAPYLIAFLEREGRSYAHRPTDEERLEFFSAFYKLCKLCEEFKLDDVTQVPGFEEHEAILKKYAPNKPVFQDVQYTKKAAKKRI